MKKTIEIILALSALAYLSYLTTGSYWSGAYLDGYIVVKLVDEEDKPIQGANFDIYSWGSLSDYPFESGKKSNSEGIVTYIKNSGGTDFGGFSWNLFWLIPMGNTKGPNSFIEVSAPGFETLKSSIDVCYKHPDEYEAYEDFPKKYININGREEEFIVIQNTIKLKKK